MPASIFSKIKEMSFLKKMARLNKRNFWIIVLVLIAATGGGIYYYEQVYLPAQTSSTTATMQTATARKGDLVIYASGTGTLTALNQADLGFKTSGQVKEINVKVGDTVKTVAVPDLVENR